MDLYATLNTELQEGIIEKDYIHEFCFNPIPLSLIFVKRRARIGFKIINAFKKLHITKHLSGILVVFDIFFLILRTMERYCSFLLMVFITCTIGFPLSAQGYPDRYVLVKPIDISELRNIIKPINLVVLQDTSRIMHNGNSQNNERESQNQGEFFNKGELQTEGGHLTKVESQNQEKLQNRADSRHITRAQNLSGELQIGEEPQEKSKIKLVDNQLIIENLLEDGTLEIYNIMGVKVYNRRVNAGTSQQFLSLPKGYYIIRIGKLTRKIAIK